MVCPQAASSSIPVRVYSQEFGDMHDTTRRKVTQRLKRVEGQVGGMLHMAEDNRYCSDILMQISAARAVLHKI